MIIGFVPAVDRTIHAEAGRIGIFDGNLFPMAIFEEIEHEPLSGRGVICAGGACGVDHKAFETAIFEIYGVSRVEMIVEIKHIQAVRRISDGLQDGFFITV
jgi:hypothetical protein